MEEFHQKMYDLLAERKNEIIRTLMTENEELKSSLNDIDISDPGDIASNELDRQTLDAIGVENSRALAKITSAMSRLQTGTYGVCAKCGKMIAHDRLAAIPEAVYCINCQAETERRR